MIEKTIPVERVEHVINVFGSFDQNLRMIESEYGVTVVNRDDLICTFSDQSLTVDFTDVIKKSKLAQLKVKGFNLFDLVRLTGLVPEADGLHIYSQWGLKRK